MVFGRVAFVVFRKFGGFVSGSDLVRSGDALLWVSKGCWGMPKGGSLWLGFRLEHNMPERGCLYGKPCSGKEKRRK